jgi:hypothetical protein
MSEEILYDNGNACNCWITNQKVSINWCKKCHQPKWQGVNYGECYYRHNSNLNVNFSPSRS